MKEFDIFLFQDVFLFSDGIDN